MWILTGGDDQVHLWRQMLEQKGEDIVNSVHRSGNSSFMSVVPDRQHLRMD